MKKIKIIFSLILMLIIGGNVFAVGITNNAKGILEKVRERAQMNIQEFEQNRAELKNLMEQNQIEFRNLVQEKREQLKALLEQKRIELKNRLKLIKDETKRQIVERIYDNVNKLNERLTNHYLNILEKLEVVLERIENRTSKAVANGVDVSAVVGKIEQAKNAIAHAREVVKEQSEKIYEPPQITDEESLRMEVGELRQQLHQDLKAVEAKVKEARQAVKEAAVQLAQIPKINILEIPTTTQPTL